MKPIKIWVVLAVMAWSVASALAADAGSVDEALKQAKSYKLGGDRKPLDALAQQAVASQKDPAARAELAKKIASILDDKDATYEAKDFACRQLYVIGTPAEIPTVAKLLGDEKLGHMGRYVLESMGNAEADAAMREALPKAQGREKVGLIGSLGNRKDAKAVPALKELLGGTDEAVACAAAASLGKIGGDDAVAVLVAARKQGGSAKMQGAVAEALLEAADGLAKAGGGNFRVAGIYHDLMKQEGAVGVGALRGLAEVAPETARTTIVEWLKGENAAKRAAAIGAMRQSKDPNASKVLIDAFASLPGEAKVMVVDVLGSKGDPAAKPMIVKLVGEGDEGLRVAAIRALGSLGDASDVPMLADQAANGQGGAKDAARQSLARLKGKDVDGAIVNAAAAGPAEVRVELIRALAARAASSANDKLLAIAGGDQNEQVRVAALGSLGQLVNSNEYPKLVDLLVKAKTDADRDAARKAVGDAVTRMDNRDDGAGPIVAALSNAPKETKVALLGALTRIGGAKALEAVRGLRKDADATVAEAAARSLAEWQDASAIDDMLDIAKNGNERQKVLALQGLNRVLSQPTAGKSAQEKLAIYKQMMDASQRPQEKKLVIAGLGDMKDPAAFGALVPLVGDQALKNEAASAVVKVAKAVWDNNKPAAKSALEKVVAASVDEGIKKQAQEQLGK